MLEHWYTFVSVGYHCLFLLVIMVIYMIRLLCMQYQVNDIIGQCRDTCHVGTPARKGHLSCLGHLSSRDPVM